MREGEIERKQKKNKEGSLGGRRCRKGRGVTFFVWLFVCAAAKINEQIREMKHSVGALDSGYLNLKGERGEGVLEE